MKQETNEQEFLSQINSSVNGLVLSGGLSTRMGKDKGELHYHNKSQRKHLYDLLLPHCKEVFISCNAEQSKYIDLPVIEDAYVNIGPLGGILSAFQTNPNIAWLAVACDLPFLNDEVISYLTRYRNANKLATAFWNEKSNSPEPLVTIWEPSAFSFLQQSFKEDNRSPRKILINADVEILYLFQQSVFENVNTVEEYNKYSHHQLI